MFFKHKDAVRLEQALNRVEHLGVPIGSTLATVFNLHLIEGKRSWAWKDLMRDALSLLFHLARPLALRFRPEGSIDRLDDRGEARVLVTLLSASYRSVEMMLPVVNQFKPEEFVLIRPDGGVSEAVRGVEPSITWGEMFRRYCSLSGWLWQINTVFRSLVELWRILPPVKVPRRTILGLLDYIAVQCRRVEAMTGLLRSLRPSLILTEYDRNYLAAPLILAAKNTGIPTVSLVHGLTDPPDAYLPVLADWLFCWGPAQANQFADFGFPREKIVVVGNPRFRSEPIFDRRTAKVQMGLDPEKPLAVLATGPIDESDRRHMVRVFCESIRNVGDFEAAIRLHPVEQLSFYSSEIGDFPEVRFLAAASPTLELVLASANLLVSYNSAIVLDALLIQCPVVFLDVTSNPAGIMTELLKNGYCVSARSGAELTEILRDVAVSTNSRGPVGDTVDRFSEWYCPFTESESARRIADSVKLIVRAQVPMNGDV